MRCGRGSSRNNIIESRICNAAIDYKSDGINEGKNGGRICWAIVGTLCNNHSRELICGIRKWRSTQSCLSCSFFKKVKKEQGYGKFTTLKKETVNKLKSIIIMEIGDN